MERSKSPQEVAGCAAGGTDSDFDADLSVHSAMHSAATTQPSSPRPVGELFAPCTASSLPWERIRQRLFQMALDGDEDVEYYGDIISDRGAIERFLSAAKGNVDKATEQMRAHLHWRRKYKVEDLVTEDFSELKAHGELYWGGVDNDGVATMTWILRKHDANRVPAERFVRFLVHQIEMGMRASPQYPNTPFNIIVDLSDVGFGNNDTDMAGLLQTVLVQNYPKVRKSLYVFPVNWFVHLFWDTIIKPILSTLQPDIEDKICPLTGDYEAKLKERFATDQIEVQFGGTLEGAAVRDPSVLPYQPVSVKSMLRAQRPAPVQHTASAAQERAAPSSGSPSSTTLRAAQKLVREEQRVRRKEARTRMCGAEGGAIEGRGQSRQRWGVGAGLASWALGTLLCVGYWCVVQEAAGVGLSVVVASGVAVAVKAMAGGAAQAEASPCGDEKLAVARVKRERGAALDPETWGKPGAGPWIARYAQACGF